MNHSPSFVVFLQSSTTAFVLLMPIVAVALYYDFDRNRPWPVWLRNLFCGVVTAAALFVSATTLQAAEVIGDWCVTKCPFADWYMWWLLSCFLC